MTDEFNSYQAEAMRFAICPDLGVGVYPALGLAGEAGELCEKIKKLHRDAKGIVSPVARAEILAEAGDVLWYLARIGVELGFSLSEVAEGNLNKLASRARRGTLSGSGDAR